MSSNASNGPSLSAMLMDPRGHKDHLSNGTPSFTTHRDMDVPFARHSSEPRITSSLSPLSTSSSNPSFSKDDAHEFLKGQGRGSKSTKTQTINHPQQSFDPRQLLDPKGGAKMQPRKSASSLRSSPSSNGLQKRASEEPEAQGMGGFIERIHGITEREQRPNKRQKTDTNPEDDEERRKATFAGGGKGGDIGEFMREKRKEAQADSGPSGTVVDLTAGMLGPRCS